ncbi:MAG: CheR family methyltransferase [Candidatus Kapaibacteriota bacterium]
MAFSFFFRDIFILERLAEIISDSTKELKVVKIWDAGCALGQEPYSFAILLAEKLGYFTFKRVVIYATDVDETGEFGKTITNGIYPFQDISRIPNEIRDKFFRQISEDKFQIIDEIRSRVKFQRHDLLSFLPVDADFIAIICKNVLLHFSHSDRVKVLEMFYKALKTGGYLTVEQTQKIPDELANKFIQIFSNVSIYQKV